MDFSPQCSLCSFAMRLLSKKKTCPATKLANSIVLNHSLLAQHSLLLAISSKLKGVRKLLKYKKSLLYQIFFRFMGMARSIEMNHLELHHWKFLIKHGKLKEVSCFLIILYELINIPFRYQCCCWFWLAYLAMLKGQIPTMCTGGVSVLGHCSERQHVIWQ